MHEGAGGDGLVLHEPAQDDGLHAAVLLLHDAPPGFAFILRKRMGIWAEFNDIRPNGSKPLPSYSLAAFRLVHPSKSVTQVVQQFIGFYGNQKDVQSILHARRWTYTVSTAQDSVGWSSGMLSPELVQVHSMYMHRHGIAMADMLLFQGTPDAVFDDIHKAKMARNNLQYGEDVFRSVLNNIKKRQLRSGASRLSCAYSHSVQIEAISVAGGSMAGWLGGSLDR